MAPHENLLLASHSPPIATHGELCVRLFCDINAFGSYRIRLFQKVHTRLEFMRAYGPMFDNDVRRVSNCAQRIRFKSSYCRTAAMHEKEELPVEHKHDINGFQPNDAGSMLSVNWLKLEFYEYVRSCIIANLITIQVRYGAVKRNAKRRGQTKLPNLNTFFTITRLCRLRVRFTQLYMNSGHQIDDHWIL
jgi:hypothetical protein